MASNAWLTGAIAAAHAATQALGIQVDVAHKAWLGQDALGTPLGFTAPVIRSALVQEGVIHHKKPDGQIVTTKARLAFLSPVPPHGAAGRQEPIDPRDVFTLPSGLSGRIVEVPGVHVDRMTGRPLVNVVWLA